MATKIDAKEMKKGGQRKQGKGRDKENEEERVCPAQAARREDKACLSDKTLSEQPQVLAQ